MPTELRITKPKIKKTISAFALTAIRREHVCSVQEIEKNQERRLFYEESRAHHMRRIKERKKYISDCTCSIRIARARGDSAEFFFRVEINIGRIVYEPFECARARIRGRNLFGGA